jgi:hypothetical protein
VTTDKSDRAASPHRHPKGISRRNFCFACLLAPLAAFKPYETKAGEAESQFNTVLNSLGRVASAEPDLPGVRSLRAVDQKRLGEGFSKADLKILEGALYLEGIAQFEKAAAGRTPSGGDTKPLRRVTEADVREALSKPIDTSRYGREYFAGVLAEAKRKSASDRAYRRRLAEAQGAAHKPRMCFGTHTPRWICIGMGVVLAIMIIAVLILV